MFTFLLCNTSWNHNEIPEFQGDLKIIFLILKERLNYVEFGFSVEYTILDEKFKSAYMEFSLKKIDTDSYLMKGKYF